MFPHTNEITVEFMKGYPPGGGGGGGGGYPPWLRLLKRICFCKQKLKPRTETISQGNINKAFNMQDSYLHVFILSNNVVWKGSELDVFSKNKLLPTVIKYTIIFQTSYFETVFCHFYHVYTCDCQVKFISLKICDVIM